MKASKDLLNSRSYLLIYTQMMKLILSCLDLHNNLLSSKNDVIWLLFPIFVALFLPYYVKFLRHGISRISRFKTIAKLKWREK